MNKKVKSILVGTVVVLALVAVFIALLFVNRVSMNPDGTIGNTAGNLYNDGLYCEYNGTVYFSNPYAGGSLYAMNTDETNIRRLNTLNCRNILAGGKYLYFFQTGSTSHSGLGQIAGTKSFARCSLKGKEMTTLTKDVVVSGQLVNNYLYLLTTSNAGISFYKVKIDNTDKTILADYTVDPACAQNGVIYYNGTDGDHYLYALNTANDTVSEVWAGNLWYPVLSEGYIYYMDVENNYRLCRYSLAADIIEVLTEERVDCFNVGSGYIYCQTNGSSPRLICMRTDGSSPMVLAEGVYTNINMTSQYVYFQPYGDDVTTYHSYIGSGSYDSFIAAQEAALTQ